MTRLKSKSIFEGIYRMSRWLYNSDGDPIAFISGRYVFSRMGSFVGMLYQDDTVWNGDYIGEVFGGDRLIQDVRTLRETRGIPGLPGLPSFIGEPEYRGPVTIPLGFCDLDLK